MERITAVTTEELVAELARQVQRPQMKTQPCKGCGAPIFFVVSAVSGKRLPMDAQPASYAILLPAEKGKTEFRALQVPTYTTHFATCPNAEQFRQPKGARA